MGCAATPPQVVAHIQFRARIAFKLVWCPTVEPPYATFVLVDDARHELVRGTPQPWTSLPPLRERQRNYHQIVAGSKYATVADHINYSFRFLSETNKSRLGRARKSFGLARPPRANIGFHSLHMEARWEQMDLIRIVMLVWLYMRM